MLPNSSKSSTIEAFRSLQKQPGNLSRGYIAMLSRNIPTTGINFPLFEIFKGSLSNWWLSRQGKSTTADQYRAVEELPLVQRTGISATSAALSGSIAAFMVTPIDVVKTRTMLNDDTVSNKKGMIGTMRQVYCENGIRGLFRGAILRSAWAAFGTGLYLSTYEWAKVALQNDGNEQ